jgi:hypothetical protein
MATTGSSLAQAKQQMRSAEAPPKWVVLVTVDGAPRTIMLLGSGDDAAKASTDASLRSVYKPVADEGDGHYVRCSLHAVQDTPEPGLPPFLRSVSEGFQTWEMNASKRPASVKPMKNVTQAAEAEKKRKAAATKKTTAKSARKGTAKKASSRKPTTRKPARKASKRTTTRRRRSTR